MFRRLDHHRVTGRQSRCNLPGEKGQRRVPGGDGSNHPIGFPNRVIEHVGFVQRNHAALKLVRKARKVVKVLRQTFDLGPNFAQALAVVAALSQSQAFNVSRYGLTELSEPNAALSGSERGPGSFKGSLVGRLGGPGHVLGITLRYSGPHPSGGWIPRVKVAATDGIAPLTVDPGLVVGNAVHKLGVGSHALAPV